MVVMKWKAFKVKHQAAPSNENISFGSKEAHGLFEIDVFFKKSDIVLVEIILSLVF